MFVIALPESQLFLTSEVSCCTGSNAGNYCNCTLAKENHVGPRYMVSDITPNNKKKNALSNKQQISNHFIGKLFGFELGSISSKNWTSDSTNIIQNLFPLCLSVLPISKLASASGATLVPLKVRHFSNIQIQTSCPHKNHPEEENNFFPEVSRTNKAYLHQKSKGSVCVIDVDEVMYPFTVTEYYDILTSLSKSRLILNHVAENGQRWFSEHCYQKIAWMSHSNDNRCPLKASLLSSILLEPNTLSPYLTSSIGSVTQAKWLRTKPISP